MWSVAVKTMPPSHITVISEQSFPTSLLTHWKHPISDVYVKLIYEIRFRAKADPTWTYVSTSCLVVSEELR